MAATYTIKMKDSVSVHLDALRKMAEKDSRRVRVFLCWICGNRDLYTFERSRVRDKVIQYEVIPSKLLSDFLEQGCA